MVMVSDSIALSQGTHSGWRPSHDGTVWRRLVAVLRAAPARTAGGLVVGVALTVCGSPAVDATERDAHWTASWTASPQPTWGGDFAFPTNVPAMLEDRTVRQTARLSVGGRGLRIELSNAYGSHPVQIGAAHVALAADGGRIVPGSDRIVTFGGHETASIPPGAPLLSDPIDLPVPALGRVSVSVYLPRATPTSTFHWDGRQTAWLSHGNRVADPASEAAETMTARVLLSGIHVDTPAATDTVVVLGDSITDGNGASIDADTRWPDFLAARLAPRGVAVLNAGISGARLLSDRMGVNALARFDRDVLGQPGVRSVIVLLGINDISWPGTAFDRNGAPPSAEALIAAHRQLIARARARGVRIIGATLTPFEGALAGTPLGDYHQPEKDVLRGHINRWIRESGEFDAVIDFDAALRDPAHPSRLRPEVDTGDHLHPGDHGNAVMADAVDLDAL
jgi:lysophospholipase L1-like esterase